MSSVPFVKMQGCGNDFVIIDRRAGSPAPSPELIRRLADRHRGIGCDQLVLLEPAAEAVARLRFFNADGGEAGACGNATRCVARLLADSGEGREPVLASAAGRIPTRVHGDGRVTVWLPSPRLAWNEIPVAEPCDTLALPVAVPGLPPPVGVNMGNPHAVFFVEELEGLDVARLGSRIARHPLFPEGVNVGFAQPRGGDGIRLRVFERGSGLTLACGSGACAALVAAVRRGLVEKAARLILDGGVLEISWPGEGPVEMTGPAAYCFRGTFDPRDLLSD